MCGDLVVCQIRLFLFQFLILKPKGKRADKKSEELSHTRFHLCGREEVGVGEGDTDHDER